MTQHDRKPGETAREYLMRTRRTKKNHTNKQSPAHERNPHDDPLTPWRDKPGNNQPGDEITPPHPQCVSIETTGWHPDMTGYPAIVMHEHAPRPAVVWKPCAFTWYIGVRTGDTNRLIYLEPKDVFVLEPEE